MMKKNCIFLLLDSITYDVLNSNETINRSRILFPNIYNLAKKYNYQKCISNSNCTQFVLPSLFSFTLPLDDGGYDYGIKNKKISFMEILKKEGYSTIIFSNCNQMGADNGYDRGVDENINSFDYRLILEQKLNRVILSKYRKNKENTNSKIELIESYKKLLDEIKTKIINADTLIWSNDLIKINNNIKNNIDLEIDLIKKNPEIILKKILEINPASIWLFLGVSKLHSVSFYTKRVFGAIAWRIKYKITKSKLPINFLGHKTINLVDTFHKFKKKLENQHSPYFIYHHVMDLHDYENFNSFSNFFNKLLNYPKWFKHSQNVKKKRKFLYDSSLMQVDKYIGKILNILDSKTLLFITSDHGHRKSLKKQIRRSYITDDYFNEMHGEDIEIPLIANTDIEESDKNNIKLLDSVSISKKIMSKLDIEVSKYLEKNDQDKKYIISEHAGRGNFDLSKDLFFTISNHKFRMIAAFVKHELFIKFYEIQKDPMEIEDISNNKKYETEIFQMFNYLKNNRFHIIKDKLKNLQKINNKFIQI